MLVNAEALDIRNQERGN